MRRKADTIIKRTIVDQALAVHLVVHACRRSAKHRAGTVLRHFMRTYALIGDLLTKMTAFKAFTMRVEERFLQYKKRCRAYTDRIIKLWNIKWGVIY